ncbi:hypothetical protein K435DRAFT_48970 [Dendrothele bispora CBS 962.96]|uniref:Uncharacterized protein n=1 Tax=Dendrothele bispora (strain CBS 962.96) TaxID=1314807 RepID=A0A4S8M7B2_DENBC|nr:hypothetical protein K435DRAFT_48970 [Dendrothele bispora CBS 962.96]
MVHCVYALPCGFLIMYIFIILLRFTVYGFNNWWFDRVLITFDFDIRTYLVLWVCTYISLWVFGFFWYTVGSAITEF